MATKTPDHKRARFTNVNVDTDVDGNVRGYKATAYKDGKIADEEPFATEQEAVDFCNKSMNYA